jgi:hypothetical protein
MAVGGHHKGGATDKNSKNQHRHALHELDRRLKHGFVMAGLCPGHPRPSYCIAAKTWMPATKASEATPFFERLCAGMTERMVRLHRNML